MSRIAPADIICLPSTLPQPLAVADVARAVVDIAVIAMLHEMREPVVRQVETLGPVRMLVQQEAQVCRGAVGVPVVPIARNTRSSIARRGGAAHQVFC